MKVGLCPSPCVPADYQLLENQEKGCILKLRFGRKRTKFLSSKRRLSESKIAVLGAFAEAWFLSFKSRSTKKCGFLLATCAAAGGAAAAGGGARPAAACIPPAHHTRYWQCRYSIAVCSFIPPSPHARYWQCRHSIEFDRSVLFLA